MEVWTANVILVIVCFYNKFQMRISCVDRNRGRFPSCTSCIRQTCYSGDRCPVFIVVATIYLNEFRTVIATITTLLTIVTLYILGVDSIKQFALPLIIGIVAGIYSANMINGYVWALLMDKRAKK